VVLVMVPGAVLELRMFGVRDENVEVLRRELWISEFGAESRLLMCCQLRGCAAAQAKPRAQPWD
jgi:hypothetical protein